MKNCLRVFVTCVGLSVLAATANAVLVIESPIQVLNGALGFGNAATALTLQEKDLEFGAVEWDGAMDVLVDGAIMNKSETVTAAEIATFGTPWGIHLNINEDASNQIDSTELTVNFYNSAGVVFETATINVGPLMEVGSGQGGDGYFFELSDTMGEISNFLATGSNRIGLSATITGSSSGPESFRIAAVPEPSSFLLLGLVGAGLFGYRCTKKK